MSTERFAILVDSCSDIPEEFIDKYKIYVVPMRLLYKGREYLDKVDISPQEVYDNMHIEVPTTSQPTVGDVASVLNRIAEDGYTTVIAIAISSGLSGSYNSMRLAAEQEKRLKVYVVDTLSIGIGAGASAIYAGSMIEQKLAASEIIEKLNKSINNARIYYSLATLEYLAKGGRIGKVAAALGFLLRIKPIITCDEEGKYTIASKVRGRAHALKELVNLTVNQAKKHVRYYILIAHGSAKEEAQKLLAELKLLLPDSLDFIFSELSPVLGVHTGPGMVGVGIYPID
ncbi:MAG: DegV family protein [Christensenellales bacterium]|nr:DegV family protein [Christensenellaceae bacterium]